MNNTLERRSVIKGIGAAAGATAGSTLLSTGAAGSEWTEPVAQADFEPVTVEQTGHSVQAIYENTGDAGGIIDVAMLDANDEVVQEYSTQVPIGHEEIFYFDNLPGVYQIDAGGDRWTVGFDPVQEDRSSYEAFTDDPYVITREPESASGGTEFRMFVTHAASTFDSVSLGFDYRLLGTDQWQTVELSNPGFDVSNATTVSGLEEDQPYEVRAVLRSNGTIQATGAVETFTHEPDFGWSGWS